MATAKQRATYDDLRKLPDHVVGQIVDGELIASPRPAPPHLIYYVPTSSRGAKNFMRPRAGAA